MKVETTEAMRVFNEELEDADMILEANRFPMAGELGLQATLEHLRSLGLRGTANGLQAAAEAVGYQFGGGK